MSEQSNKVFQNKGTKQNKVFSEQKQQRYKRNFGFLCTFVAFVLKKLCFALLLCPFCSEKYQVHEISM
jgi:hypothetical protein